MNLELNANVQEKLSEICRRYHVKKLSIFGSHLHDEARPDSDLDILVEFIPSHVPGFAFISLQDEISELLGRTVDLRTPEELSKYFREAVVTEASQIYANSQE